MDVPIPNPEDRPWALRLMRAVYETPDRHANGMRLVRAFQRMELRIFRDRNIDERILARVIRRYIEWRRTNRDMLQGDLRVHESDLPSWLRPTPPPPRPPRPQPDVYYRRFPTVGFHPWHPAYYRGQSATVQRRIRQYWARERGYRRFFDAYQPGLVDWRPYIPRRYYP